MVELQSGRDPEGTKVPVILPEPLVDKDGYTLIPAGTTCVGIVVRSRRGTAFSAVVNEPPRLEARFETMRLPDGTVLELTGNVNGEIGLPYIFTQKNTAPDQRDFDIEEVMKDPALKETMQKLNDAYAEDRALIKWGPNDRENLEKISEKLNLTALTSELKKGGPDVLDRVTHHLLRDGTRVLAGDSTALLGAALQAATLAGEAGRAISRAFVGPNIRAHIGTAIILRLTHEQTVQRIEGSKK